MAIKVVIANFSRATDLTRKPSSGHDAKELQPSQKDGLIGNASNVAATSVPGSTVYQETKTERETPVKVLLAGDVRSFALLLLEMIAWLKMIRVPEDGPLAGNSKSWTLDRSLKRLTRGWTLAPSNREAWTDDEDAHIAANRNLSSSVDSYGSSTDDILSDSGPTMHCWENTVADIRDKCRCHSVEEFNSSSSPADHPSWEEIGTFPRRTKRHKHYPTEEFSSEKTIQSQQRTGSKYTKSDSSSGSSQKELTNGSASKEEAKRSLAKMTEDGSCCIVNPYFDMMASDDELPQPKDNLSYTPKQSASLKAPPDRIVTGSEKTKPDPIPKNGRKNLNHFYSVDESNSKRDSLCSLDSGISSHQSSMRSSNSDQTNSRKEEILLPGFKPKSRNLMLKRQRLHQSDMHGTFEAFPENDDDGVFITSKGETHPGTGKHVETWIENHTVPNGHYKQNIIVERTQIGKPRLPETLEETEPSNPTNAKEALNKLQNGDLHESIDKDNKTESSSINGDVVNGEKCNSKSKVTVTRSASSLSQFYVRKRAPRPHNITIVPGSTATLPVSMQRRSIHAPDSPRLLDMARCRPSSCHGQVACNKSNSLDSKDCVARKCCVHRQCSSEGQACPSNGPLHRQSRSLEDHCGCHSPIGVSRTCPTTQPNNDSPHCIPASIRKLHRQDAILESISESSRISHASRSFEDQIQPKRQSVRKKVAGSKRTPTSGITQQHVNFCQELQALLPCLPKVVLGFWWKQQGCGQAVLQWIDSIKDYDGCLYNQLINILDSCWSKEPALSSSEVHLMLDNCLTEVAL